MGMFDWYRPCGPVYCPVDGRILDEWQGKDGTCALFLWQEGESCPVDQIVDEECRLDPEDRKRFTLPKRFVIYSYDCPDHYPIEADCFPEDSVWVRTVPRPFTPN